MLGIKNVSWYNEACIKIFFSLRQCIKLRGSKSDSNQIFGSLRNFDSRFFQRLLEFRSETKIWF